MHKAAELGAKINNTVVMGYCFSGARHAFTVFGGDRYQAEADRKSWQRFLYFLENKLH